MPMVPSHGPTKGESLADVAEMQGLVTHRGEHAAAEQAVPGGMGEPQRQQHLATGVGVHSAVVGHPSEIERWFRNRRHQSATDPLAVLAVEQRGHVLT